MAHQIVEISDNLIHIKLQGVMQVADQEALQAQARRLIAQGKKPRLLAILDDFQGWEKSDAWENIDFLMEHGDHIERMAIVGEARWKEEALTFVAKGLRKTEIEYFVPSALVLAEAWVRA